MGYYFFIVLKHGALFEHGAQFEHGALLFRTETVLFVCIPSDHTTQTTPNKLPNLILQSYVSWLLSLSLESYSWSVAYVESPSSFSGSIWVFNGLLPYRNSNVYTLIDAHAYNWV